MSKCQRGKLQIEKAIQEKKVIESELSSLKKNARVYSQQPNSNIFFRADKDKVFQDCKKSLDNLIQEYKAADESKAQESCQGEEEQ